MASPIRIAFGYKMGVGKDTACDYLKKNYGIIKLSFAAPLYFMMDTCQSTFNLERKKDRKFLQQTGDWAREQNENVFVDLLINIVSNNAENEYCVSDCRFLNEFQALKKAGFMMVRIDRSCREDRVGTGKAEHQSENELDSLPQDAWDMVIVNDGTIESFYEDVESAIKYCRQKNT